MPAPGVRSEPEPPNRLRSSACWCGTCFAPAGRRWPMRELESSLPSFGEYLLKAQIVRANAAPYFVRWVRRFLGRPASNEPLVDQVRRFCEERERHGGIQDWQVRQADQALRVYFVNFLKRNDWQRRPDAGVDPPDTTNPLTALDLLHTRLRTRHYSYRTECIYVDWVRRFLEYAATRQGVPIPRVDTEGVRDFLTHLAVNRQVSTSTQNQAFSAILFLCREVLRIPLDDVSSGVKAKRGSRLPVVLSMPETASLLAAMPGTARLMATLIYGGGLRVSECCELRVKDLDLDQGLVFVRSGKGDKDRATLLPEAGRDQLRAHLKRVEALHEADRKTTLAGVWLREALERKYPIAGKEFGWFWVFPSRTLSTDPRRHRAAAPHERFGRAEGHESRGHGGAHPQARVGAHAAELRHAPVAQRRGHPADPGVSPPLQRGDDDGLHSRREAVPEPAAKSARHPSRPRHALALCPARPAHHH